MREVSPKMHAYFDGLNKQVLESYEIANKAKSKGYDPEDHVDIPLAKNMAERVEGLIRVAAPAIVGSGMVERITELESEYGKLDWRVAFTIALEVAQQKFCKFKEELEAMEVGIRAGIAYLTIGAVASPLEGFTELKLVDRRDGKGKYFALLFSGPIRSAGGTASAASVILSDYVRKKMGYAEYDPTSEEIKRQSTEIVDYHERITNLQYFPSQEEVEFLTEKMPVQITGEPSERLEVSNYKDLPRVETNNIRNGVCLVVGEGIAQKAPKLWKQLDKWGKDFDLGHWKFLESFIDLQKKIKSKQEGREEKEEDSDSKIKPDYTFIKDLVAGRPVVTHPLRVGGLRLRYGRARNSGLSATAIHPSTMYVLNEFLGIGAQLKTERPGKGTALSSCDSIECPIVKLKGGDVVRLETLEDAKKHSSFVEEIIFLGDILVSYGDFFNRAHPLVPCGFNEEWYLQILKSKKIKQIPKDVDSSFKLSEAEDVPLHPKYTYHYSDITPLQLVKLLEWISRGVVQLDPPKVILPLDYEVSEDLKDQDPKRVLELIGVPHTVVTNEHVVVKGFPAKSLYYAFGLDKNPIDIEKITSMKEKSVLEILKELSGVTIKDKSGTFIGARMGRPEKSKMRKLTGSPQALFPVGSEGGRLRSFQAALGAGKVVGQFPRYQCEKCEKDTIYPVCEDCEGKTERVYYCVRCEEEKKEAECKAIDPSTNEEHGKNRGYFDWDLPIEHYFRKALGKIKQRDYPDLIKGVRGTSNEDHTPENLSKGILRASYDLYVNKDGTIRYDMTELPLTHFKPIEIGTSVSVLKKLGYTHDYKGGALVSEDQVVEIKPQDVVLPSCPDSVEEGSDIVLLRVASFIDDLLKNFYSMKAYYNLKDKKDLVGHLVVALAPHTSAGTVCRILGFSKTQGFYTHPLLHCALRRDCDGDEAAVMLLMDSFLNFSKKYLPSHRGAVQDAPLVLTSQLIPSEVDDMVFDMDIAFEYPLEFYEQTEKYGMPWDVEVNRFGNVLKTEKQYEGMGFTHDVSDINNGVLCSSYKSIPTMKEKVFGQMDIAEKVRAVDELDVARLVIERHFVRDIKGNLRKFSMQQFRCVGCNEKYRRPPLSGICLKCGGKLLFTIAEGSIVKYLEPSIELARKYKLPAYLQQTLDLVKQRIESVFGRDEDKQAGLQTWFG